MTLGERVKARRQVLGLSQREMAARLGYTDHTSLTRIESGKADPPQSRLIKIAEVLGVTPGYLMGLEDLSENPKNQEHSKSMTSNDPQLLELIKNFNTLDAVDRLTVSALVASLATKKKE